MLKVQNVTLRFGGLVANNDVSMEVREGKITGLIGPNGAGKTTFFNCISGVYTPNEGKIIFDGKEIQGFRPYQINKAGISRTYQIINLFRKMKVYENVIVGMHSRLNSKFTDSLFKTKKEREEEKKAYDKALELLDFVGLLAVKDEPAGSLSYGKQRLLEICRALASDPKILLLDEPAAGMNGTEKNELDALCKKIVERGISILIIEHDMKLMMGLADYMYVLNYGKLLAEGVPSEIQNNPAVIEAYLGGE
ncbi:ABC transporter ATP-binding protein [Lacrimispora sp.]|uniref:ABC transporter ATP-binding protein n=1 Tax=Lacrimispora sp. TaxID=2719234 RepID=UPI00289CBB51|nr:ABC transporter ATP-binding protein [Lacrimispora sp.]